MSDPMLPPLRSHSPRAYWICQIAGWGLLTLSRFLAVALLHLPLARALTELVLLHAAGLWLSHLLRAYVWTHRWDTLSASRLTWRIVAAGFLLGAPLGLAMMFTSVVILQDPAPFLEALNPDYALHLAPAVVLLLHILNWAAAFMIWLAIYFGVLYLRKRQSAELVQSELIRALQLAELRLLKSQLNPHFLFNALNTVRSLIADDPARAQGAVTRLANTLRYSLGASQEELATFEQELKVTDDYLAIESLRFEDRLSVRREIAPDVGAARIPIMLLQTVVENAIKHGIAKLPRGGVLSLSAMQRDGVLLLQVENPRPDEPSAAPQEGIGLRNAAERLRLLFGARASVHLDLSQPNIAVVRIRIPLQK